MKNDIDIGIERRYKKKQSNIYEEGAQHHLTPCPCSSPPAKLATPRPSLHSLCSFRSGTMALADARVIVVNRQNVSCNRERKNKGKRRGREERAQDRVLDGETSLPIQARSKVTTATNSAVHAHRSQAPSSAIAALAIAHSAQAQWRSPMLTPSSQTGRTLVAIVKEKNKGKREEEEKNARKIEYWMGRQVSPSKRARRSRLQLTALFTLIGRRLPLRPSLHSHTLIPLRHNGVRRCSRHRRKQAER